MAIDWGAFQYSGGNGMRVGIDISVEVVGHSDAGCTFTVDYYTDNQHTYGDTQTMNLGGSISDSFQFTNNDGPGAVRRATRTYTYDYKVGEYGSSPGNKTFSANVGGTYNGVTPSSTSTAAIDTRPIAAPAPPTAVNATRVSDETIKISWVRHATLGEPYASYDVQRYIQGHSSAYEQVGSPSGDSTSYNAAVIANRWYNFRVRSANGAGVSSFVPTGDVYTSPATPTGCTRTDAGANQTITWTNTCDYPAYRTQIWHALNGVWDSTYLGDVADGVTTYTHVGAGTTDKHTYKVRAKTTTTPALYSDYSASSTESSGVTSAPAAPTGLVPNSDQVFDPTGPIPMSWVHNTTDGSAQTQYQLRHRVVGAGTWTTGAVTVSATAAYTLPAGTYGNSLQVEWQVMTWGAGSTGSPFSASATFRTSSLTVTKLPVYLNPVTGMLEASQTPVAGGIAPVICRLTRPGNQAIADSTDTAITFNTKVEDASNFLAVSPGTTLTVPAGCAGLYFITGNLSYVNQTTPAGNRIAKVTVNGTQACFYSGMPTAAQLNGNSVSYACTVRLAVGDTIQLTARQNQGASVNVDGSIGAGISIQLTRVAL